MTWRPVDLDPVALVLVGKPARGKTFTGRRLERYLTWLGYRARVFNVGRYRRERLGAGQPPSFFQPDNADGVSARESMARAAVDDMLAWLREGGEIGLLDATNSTRARRAWVREALSRAGVKPLFVELSCEDMTIIEANVRETKVHSPDYTDVDADAAVRDFMQRIAAYDRAYEPVGADEGDFIRIVDLGRRMELQGVHGYLPGRLLTFLMHLHDRPRRLYLTRHGESAFNVMERIGGDAALSPSGRRYARRLAGFVTDTIPDEQPLVVWTSTLKRTIETAEAIGRPTRAWKLLDEIDAGICDGMTYAEIGERMPDEYAARKADKFRYRYPRGESYQDVIARLDPVILELERHRRPVLVVAHQAVLRALYGYLTGTHTERIPHLEIPLHTVIRLTPGPYGNQETRVPLGPEPDGTLDELLTAP